MAIIVEGSKKYIIDKSLLEISEAYTILNYKYINYFISLLTRVAVDFIEINRKVINKISSLPEGVDYVFRIDEIKDVNFLKKYSFKYVAIDYDNALKLGKQAVSSLKDKEVIMEIDVAALDKLFLDENNEILNKFKVISLRIKNIFKYDLGGWEEFIKSLKTKYSLMVDFCASNEYYMGTAISIEGCLDGADFITSCFNGEEFGLSSLEEVIMALKTVQNSTILGNTKLFNELSKVYKKITRESVYPMKPVLGRDIFKYESGIHADGIEKNPNTYEPYNPAEAGQYRKLYIGKHSGKKAVMVRLKQLRMDYKLVDLEILLDEIREESIKIQRNIRDDELTQMYNNLLKI